MNRWNGGEPHNLKELFDFYHLYVKQLYSYAQTYNELPVQLLFELNAALDHLSRYWTINVSEADAVQESFGHLKRSCLDVFKLQLLATVDQYEQIKKLDTAVIDNGRFTPQLHQAIHEIRVNAKEARRLETIDGATNLARTFQLWEYVFFKCLEFEEKFFLHPEIPWARKRGVVELVRTQWLGFLVGVISSLVATAIIWLVNGE